MTNCTRAITVAVALLCIVSFAAGEPTPVNDKVVAFCKDQLGKKVGDGECSSLADAALKAAGAKPRTAFKPSPTDADSVWGDLVYALEIKGGSPVEKQAPGVSIGPGDVVQLRDARFQGANSFLTYPQHTAVVLDVKEKGRVLAVLEQNVNGKKAVQETVYRLDDLAAGWVRVYRPVPDRK